MLPYYNDKRQRIIDVLRSKGGLYRADSGSTAPAVQPWGTGHACQIKNLKYRSRNNKYPFL